MAAALQAGVPREHLKSMSRALQANPSRLTDYPRPDAARAELVGELGEDLEEEEEELEEEVTQGNSNQISSAIVKLTNIMAKLTAGGNSSSPLEDALEQAGGVGPSGSAGDISTSMGRKHAAARRALQKAFVSEPSLIWKSVEENMATDFNMQSTAPNGQAAFSSRGWCEHRSKIQPYIRTCRWIWGIAGIHDALRQGQVDSARSRCCLLLAAAEQESLDHGSFLLSQEFLMEPPVPISSFQNHILPDSMEMATTRLLDGRWIEAYADRLKQVDAYIEMRKKVNTKARPNPGGGTGSDAAGKGKGKSKGKGKQKQNQEQEAPAQS